MVYPNINSGLYSNQCWIDMHFLLTKENIKDRVEKKTNKKTISLVDIRIDN